MVIYIKCIKGGELRKILQNMPLKRLIAIAKSYKIERVEEMDREKLIEEIYSLSVKSVPVDKDGNPLILPR